jgi:hypothetical protein
METPDIKIFEILISKSKKGPIEKLKKVTIKNPAEIDGFILALRAKKKKFKIVENGVEKMYEFNGNNYIISSIKL